MAGETKKLPQILASFAATVGSFGLGTGLAWSSPALPFLVGCNLPDMPSGYDPDKSNCTLPVSFSDEEGSWIGSMFNIGALVAAFATGLLMPAIGRKWTMILLSVPFIIGWICLIIPAYKTDISSPALFLVGRFFTGVGGGGFALAPPVYISEITETSIRGAMGSVMQFMLTIGIAVVNAMGIENAVDWGIITILCVIPPGKKSALLSEYVATFSAFINQSSVFVFLAASAGAMFFMPESPYYLISKENEAKALASLQWLRGTKNVSGEMDELKRAYREQASLGNLGYKKLFTDGVYLRPFLIMIALMFFQQFAGINAVLFYLKDVFIKAGSTMDPGLSAFIIGIVQVNSKMFFSSLEFKKSILLKRWWLQELPLPLSTSLAANLC